MTYTQLTLPQKGFHITHKTILGALSLLIITSLFVVLVLTYVKIEDNNLELAQKLSKFSTTKPVSAIATPAAGAGAQQSLVPVDKAQVQEFLDKLQSIALVPLDEAPTLATIVDISKLREEAFFKNAEIDDKLFVYQQAQLAILYRPSVEKIVNMATLFDQSGGKAKSPASPQVQGSSTQATSGAQLQYKLAVYFATDSSLLRAKVGKALNTMPSIEVVKEALTRETTYTGVTIVDLKGGQSTIVTELVKKLGGEKGSLPEGEDKPDADILAIVAE
jgi:hypothetical protein